MRKNQKISTSLTFVAFTLGRVLLPGGGTPARVKRDSIDENTVGKATLFQRSHVLTSVGITALFLVYSLP